MWNTSTTSQSISGVTIDVVQAVHDVPTDDSEFVVNDHADGLVEFIASKAWPAGLVLAEYFVWRLRNLPLESPDPNRPLRFLELGAGTGITSLFAAKTLGDHRSSVHVYVSDLALACPLIQANIAANLDHATNVSMHALPLDWTDIPSTETWLASLDPPGLDIVYASDVVYFPHLFAPLIDTLRILAPHARELILTCRIRSLAKEGAFYARLGKWFRLQPLADEEWNQGRFWKTYRGEYVMLRCCLRDVPLDGEGSEEFESMMQGWLDTDLFE